MFFIGLFGTNFKVEQAGYINVASCPCCGGNKKLHLARKYNYFHAFFIPLFKFGSSYFATCPDCASVFEVTDELGDRAYSNGTADAHPNELHLLQNNSRPRCPSCGAPLDGSDNFCRNCGNKL